MGYSKNLPPGYQYHWCDEIPSTNREALDQISRGVEPGRWYYTDCQTAGRGTHGRSWEMARGNLAASHYLHLDCSSKYLPQISILAGLAALSAIESLAPKNYELDALCLKWPNDIHLREQKICGILIESQPLKQSTNKGSDPEVLLEQGAFNVVMGFGINLVSHPETKALFPASDLTTEGWTCSFDDLFVALVRSVRDWLKIWRNGDDFETLRLAWMERSCHIGRSIEIQVGSECYQGRFTRIDQSGALVLEDEGGTEHIIASGHLAALI